MMLEMFVDSFPLLATITIGSYHRRASTLIDGLVAACSEAALDRSEMGRQASVVRVTLSGTNGRHRSAVTRWLTAIAGGDECR
jgi:hypothetical protein